MEASDELVAAFALVCPFGFISIFSFCKSAVHLRRHIVPLPSASCASQHLRTGASLIPADPHLRETVSLISWVAACLRQAESSLELAAMDVYPSLTYRDLEAALEFLEKAFGLRPGDV